jgi:uncharacterized membrane protein YbhN (UPF0104 family)
MPVMILRWSLRIFPYIVMLVALSLLYSELSGLRWDELTHTLSRYEGAQLVLAGILLALNYVIWSGYDWVSLRQLNHPVSYVQIFRTCAVAFPVTNLVGYSLITGLGIRAKYYTPYGMNLSRVAQIILFNVESWWAGFLFVLGASIIHVPVGGGFFKLSAFSTRLAGIAALSLVAVYLMACWRAHGRVVRIWRSQINLPDLLQGSMKLLVASADNIVVALTLFVLLPPGHGLSFAQFAPVYFAAQLAGMISMVPSGLGVLEGVLLLLLRPYASDASVMASLILFRLVHFMVPVLLALVSELAVRARHATSRSTGNFKTSTNQP